MIKLLAVVLIFCLLVSSTSIVHNIYLKDTQQIEIQIGQDFSSQIPQFFEIYQSSQLVDFYHVDKDNNKDNTIINSICKIQQIEQSQYIEHKNYYHQGISDPQDYYYGDKKVFKFQDLKKLNGVLDMILFDDQFIVVFESAYYSFYNVNSFTGQIKIDKNQLINANKNTSNIQQAYLSYGHFVQNQQKSQYLIFFSQDNVFIMNKTNKILQPLSGYQPLGINFQTATIKGNKIYVAAGQKGIFIYQINFTQKSISLKQQFQPFIKQKSSKTYLQVNDLYFDTKNNKFIVIDQLQGIYWVNKPLQGVLQVQCDPTGILLQNCQNLQKLKTQNILVSTCPSLLLIDFLNKNYSIISQIDFFTQSLFVNESRIYLFGEYKYAIYDINSSLVEKGYSDISIQHVNVYKNWIVISNRYKISTGYVEAEKQQIYCSTDSQLNQNIIGDNYMNLVLQGICSQIYNMPKINQNNGKSVFQFNVYDIQTIKSAKNYKQNCQIVIPIKLKIIDSSIISYLIQFAIAGLTIWCVCGGLIFLCVKDIQIKKQYQNLQEQPTGVNDKGHSQVVLSAKSQNKDEGQIQ